MTQINKQDNFINPDMNLPIHQATYQDDEIDLRELLKVIWDYKWLTVSLCTLAIIASSFYALNAQEWWVAKGKIIEPQLNDVASLYAQSQKVSAILQASNLQDNSNKEVQFATLFEPETLFKNFINNFNSSQNKKLFLADNPVFLEYLQENKIKVPANKSLLGEQPIDTQQYLQALDSWMKEIKASRDKTTSEVTLSFRSTTKASSAQLLNQYIAYIAQTVKENQFEKFLLLLDSSKNELQVSLEMAEKRAENKLSLLLQQTQYAYQIAAQGDLAGYNPNLNKEEELFEVNLGAKVLKAKMNVLKSMKDLSIIDPSISQLKITLSALNKLKVTEKADFSPFRYLDQVEPPLNRAAPKRALMVILATLLAGMLSIFIALVHYFMTKKDELVEV